MLTHQGLRVNSSRIVRDWCLQGCPWQNLELNLLYIVKKLIYQWLKKYFDNPFKDKHIHLPYGDINGPPDRSLHIYLPIIQELIEFWEGILQNHIDILKLSASPFCMLSAMSYHHQLIPATRVVLGNYSANNMAIR